MKSGIYKITNPDGKIYIGKSKNIIKRFEDYKSLNCKLQPEIYDSLKKYGWFYHTFEVIEECDIDALIIREQYWINHYGSINQGLNSNGKNRGPKNKGQKGKHILNRIFSKEILESKSKKMKKLWEDGNFKRNNCKPIKDTETNKIYSSRNECVADLNLTASAFSKLIKNSNRFLYLKK